MALLFINIEPSCQKPGLCPHAVGTHALPVSLSLYSPPSSHAITTTNLLLPGALAEVMSVPYRLKAVMFATLPLYRYRASVIATAFASYSKLPPLHPPGRLWSDCAQVLQSINNSRSTVRSSQPRLGIPGWSKHRSRAWLQGMLCDIYITKQPALFYYRRGKKK